MKHPKRKALTRKYEKKLYMVPVAIRKHPAPAIGVVALGLGVVSGIIWYTLKK